MSPEPELNPESNALPDETSAVEPAPAEKQCVNLMQMIGWFSAGMVLATLSVLVGVELRSRYKFNRRTPYDFYSRAGEQTASEFGVGV
jgi:hypothetical protein